MSNLQANEKKEDHQLGQNHVIDNLWLNFYASEHGVWIMKAQCATLLHQKLKEFKPKHILELGTGVGCSSAIMAFTCSEARIYSVDQRQKCIDIAKQLIPQGLQERIYFRKADVEAVTIPQVNPFVNWSMFKDFDWHNYDFILVDGPGPWLTTVNLGGKAWKTLAELPNADIINLLPKMNPGTIVYVDRRKHATILYDRHLGNYLEKLEDSKYHAIYRRTDKTLKDDFSDYENLDKSLESLNKLNYFNE